MRRFLFVFTVITNCILISLTVSAAEKTITAKVKSVDAAKNSITLDDLELDVTRKTKITVYGKKSTLEDIKPEQSAKVIYDDGLETAISIDVFKEISEEETLAALKGTWFALTEEANGKRIKKEEMKPKKKTLKVDGDKFTLSTTYYKVTGTIGVVSEDGPNAIDLKGKMVGGETKNGKFVPKGDEKNMTLKAIFEIKDRTLRLCYSTSDDKKDRKRPTEFETEEGKEDICVTFERTE